MDDKYVREIIDILRRGIRNETWETVRYVEGLLNMATMESVFKEGQ